MCPGRTKVLAPQVGLEPTTLRLTVAAGSITTNGCDCLRIIENKALTFILSRTRSLSITAIFYQGSFAFPFDLLRVPAQPSGLSTRHRHGRLWCLALERRSQSSPTSCECMNQFLARWVAAEPNIRESLRLPALGARVPLTRRRLGLQCYMLKGWPEEVGATRKSLRRACRNIE